MTTYKFRLVLLFVLLCSAGCQQEKPRDIVLEDNGQWFLNNDRDVTRRIRLKVNPPYVWKFDHATKRVAVSEAVRTKQPDYTPGDQEYDVFRVVFLEPTVLTFKCYKDNKVEQEFTIYLAGKVRK